MGVQLRHTGRVQFGGGEFGRHSRGFVLVRHPDFGGSRRRGGLPARLAACGVSRKERRDLGLRRCSVLSAFLTSSIQKQQKRISNSAVQTMINIVCPRERLLLPTCLRVIVCLCTDVVNRLSNEYRHCNTKKAPPVRQDPPARNPPSHWNQWFYFGKTWLRL